MASGRTPTPTTLKLLNGTLQPSRHNKAEPRLPAAIPTAPAHLTQEECEAWSYFAELLEPMGVATQQDAVAFEMLAVTFVHHQRLARSLRSGDMTYATEKANGDLMHRNRPELAALADVSRRLLVLLGRFGLTPADRARVVSLGGNAGADKVDPFAEFDAK